MGIAISVEIADSLFRFLTIIIIIIARLFRIRKIIEISPQITRIAVQQYFRFIFDEVPALFLDSF